MSLKFNNSFGLNCYSYHTVTFFDENTLIFIAGKLSLLLDLKTREQKLLSITEGSKLTGAYRYVGHLVLAVKGKPPSVCMYNIASESKKMYHAPSTIKCKTFYSVSVSTDFKFIAAQGNYPDWPLVVWLASTREIIVNFSPSATRIDVIVHDISFNESGREEFVVVGRNIFRLYEHQEATDDEGSSTFTEIVFEKFEEGEEYFSVAWPQKENMAVCSQSGRILFFRGIELLYEIMVITDVMNAVSNGLVSLNINALTTNAVNCIACTSEELYCVFAGTIVVKYELDDLPRNGLKGVMFLPDQRHKGQLPNEMESDIDFINNLAISPNYENIVVSTIHGQLLFSDLNRDGKTERVFTTLFQRQHANPIITMDIARGRPVVVTSSFHCIVFWNYELKKQETFVRFREEVLGVAIHPSGFVLAISFSLYCRICTVTYGGLKDQQILEFVGCSKSGFSYGGHLLALANKTSIEMYSVVGFKRLAKLVGHAGSISFMAWKDNDTRLVTCDDLGVICEWDLVSWSKVWENTDITSYTYLTVVPNTDLIVAVSTDKSLKCISGGKVEWEHKGSVNFNAIVTCADGKTLYTGSSYGCIDQYTLPINKTSFHVDAHKWKITHLAFAPFFDFLFSVSMDGLLFCWHNTELEGVINRGLYSKVIFADLFDLDQQKEGMAILEMTIKQCEITRECNSTLLRAKYEENMKNVLVDHERVVRAFNKEIGDLKEKIQTMLFDCSYPQELKELEALGRQRMFEQTKQLNDSYNRTKAYVEETQQLETKFEKTLKSMDEKHSKALADERTKEDAIVNRIKDLENSLMEKREATQKKQEEFEFERKTILEEQNYRETVSKKTEKEKNRQEKAAADQFETEMKKLRYLIFLVKEDAEKQIMKASGDIKWDVEEKMKSIEVLKKGLSNLEEKLKTKESLAQSQDVKFAERRQHLGNLQRSQTVSKNAIEDIKEVLKSTESDIKSCHQEINDIHKSAPLIEEEIRLATVQCITLHEKLKETLSGFRNKREMLYDNQQIATRYKSLLHSSTAETCDPEDIKNSIVQLFDQVKKGAEDASDPSLRNEFDYQIKTLRNTHQEIKEDPSVVAKKQALAEFKLSQENSKLLKDVHEVQKERDELRDLIFEMEVALGMPPSRQAKMTKEVQDTRDKIEFVISTTNLATERKMDKMKRVDNLIEEQQREIERFQTLLEEKGKNYN